MEEYIEIGQIVNTYGIKGFLKVNPFTDDITRFNKLKTIYVVMRSELKEFKIEEVKYNKNTVLLKLDGIDNIDKAEEYKNFYLKINKKDVVKLPKNSYFISDLMGSRVYTENGEFLGNINDIFSTKSNDVYVVKHENGKQILLPAIKSVIKQIDIDNKKVIVNLIEGLI